jgi:hypothetical protein
MKRKVVDYEEEELELVFIDGLGCYYSPVNQQYYETVLFVDLGYWESFSKSEKDHVKRSALRGQECLLPVKGISPIMSFACQWVIETDCSWIKVVWAPARDVEIDSSVLAFGTFPRFRPGSADSWTDRLRFSCHSYLALLWLTLAVV